MIGINMKNLVCHCSAFNHLSLEGCIGTYHLSCKWKDTILYVHMYLSEVDGGPNFCKFCP